MIPMRALLLTAMTVALGTSLNGQTTTDQSKTDDKPAAAQAAPAPKPSATKHRITVGGRTVAYTATAATIDLKSAKDELSGRMFYVAYTEDGADAAARPLTFVFNGGPGSSSMWLHMGSFGPVRVDASDAIATPPPPYKVGDNPDTVLDKTDLVFVDAMGTGFSRIVGKGEPKDFYGTDPDVDAFAQFIERYISANGRWNSPKFLMGESYGTTRSAALLDVMQSRGVAFNGAILISCYLNAYDDFNAPAFAVDLPYELYLPTMAATAWYHHRLDPAPSDLAAFLKDVRQFALGEYAHALAQGSALGTTERDAVAAKLHQLTAMPVALILNANLRVSPDRFEKELLRGERRTVGRLDARFKGIDRDAAGETTDFDAADAAFSAAFVASFNNYVRTELKFDTDDRYRPTNYDEVSRDWDDHHKVNGNPFDMPDVAEDLREAMSKNPRLKVMTANGYFDFATPFFETEYTIAHMGLDPSLVKNISFGYYQSGHMIYLNPDARHQLHADIARFIDQTLAR